MHDMFHVIITNIVCVLPHIRYGKEKETDDKDDKDEEDEDKSTEKVKKKSFAGFFTIVS